MYVFLYTYMFGCTHQFRITYLAFTFIFIVGKMLTWLDSSWWNYRYVDLFDWVWSIYLNGLDQCVVTLIGMWRERSNRLHLIISFSLYICRHLYANGHCIKGVHGPGGPTGQPFQTSPNSFGLFGWPIFLTCPGFRLGSGFTINAWLGLAWCGPGLLFFILFYFIFIYYLSLYTVRIKIWPF
jgi:hypothetical protein